MGRFILLVSFGFASAAASALPVRVFLYQSHREVIEAVIDELGPDRVFHDARSNTSRVHGCGEPIEILIPTHGRVMDRLDLLHTVEDVLARRRAHGDEIALDVDGTPVVITGAPTADEVRAAASVGYIPSPRRAAGRRLISKVTDCGDFIH